MQIKTIRELTIFLICIFSTTSCSSTENQASETTHSSQEEQADYGESLSNCEGINVGAKLMVINQQDDSPLQVLKSFPKQEPGKTLKFDTDHLAHGTYVTVVEVDKKLARVRVDKTKKLFWLPCENLSFREN